MKILLTAFFWMASPIVFGATSVPLITNEGCKVNLEKFASISSASWSGKCRDGAVDGIGIMSLTGAGGTLKLIQEYYDGEWASSQYFMDSSTIVQAQRRGQVIALKACKLSADCDLLYQTAVKSGLLKKANNSGVTGVARFFDDNTIGEETLAKLESNFSASGPNSGKNKNKGSSGTADGLDFRLQNGYIVATGGPCTAPGLYKVSIGDGAFKSVKDGSFINDYHLDGVIRSADGVDIHTMLSPDINWSETVRQNRKEANGLPPGTDKEDASKEADVVECLARSQYQYAIAFENWMKANMHLCPNCEESTKQKNYTKNSGNTRHCTKYVQTNDIESSGIQVRKWVIRSDVINNPQALGGLLENLKGIRDCSGTCGGAPEEIVAVSRDSFISLYGEGIIAEEPFRKQYSAIPFIEMVSCELGIAYE